MNFISGDVVLENLVLKQNALEELNIPVQTVYGHLGKCTWKIFMCLSKCLLLEKLEISMGDDDHLSLSGLSACISPTLQKKK